LGNYCSLPVYRQKRLSPMNWATTVVCRFIGRRDSAQ